MLPTLVVVPCYNEEQRLRSEEFVAALEAWPALRFLFVDDGSRDRTAVILGELAERCPGRAFVEVLPQNVGKAEAVRHGVLRAAEIGTELVGYWDADLATPLAVISQFAEILNDPRRLLVLGSRVRLLGGQIERSPTRHYAGRAFATLASGLLGFPIYDTQCGAKLFRANAMMVGLFEQPFELRWCFDVELLARLRRCQQRGLCNVSEQCVEFPLDTWHDVPGSKLTSRELVRVARELAQLALIVRRRD
jgi:dolichyl-phosphate beta-glucosyltransferase